MVELVKLREQITLDDYSSIAYLAGAVQQLRAEAAALVPKLNGCSVLMVNSTAQGGGVAEMMPKLVLLLQELGVRAQWAVLGGQSPDFFKLTKRIHNLIHGEGDPELTAADRDLYDDVSRDTADSLSSHLGPDDILAIHDPQPLGAGALLKQELDIHAIWRCHIGLDEDTAQTRAAWDFLKPYAEVYDHAIFSAPEYIPEYLAGRSSIIHPALDPLSHKNRPLRPNKIMGVLCDSGLAQARAPLLTPPFPSGARRLQPDGKFGPATSPDEIGLIYRPIILEVSRWDRLKGFRPLLDGFVRLKQYLTNDSRNWTPRQRRRVEIVRLVLAGPDPASIQDDPEAQEVLEELRAVYGGLAPRFQKDVVLISLPMDSVKNNALMVNALQHCATIVVQNSLREGFGLTITEAMWKGVPVIGTQACGLRQQIRDGIDGLLIENPEDPEEIAGILATALGDPTARERWARNAQMRAHTEFLVFSQLSRWIRLLAGQVSAPATNVVRTGAPYAAYQVH